LAKRGYPPNPTAGLMKCDRGAKEVPEVGSIEMYLNCFATHQ